MKTPIEQAIYETEMRLKNAEREIMLWLREKEVLQKTITILEIIKDRKP